MKSILLLCLFSILSCSLNDIIEKASCIAKNEKAAKAIVEIFEHIKKNQYSLIPELLLNDEYSELQKVSEICFRLTRYKEIIKNPTPGLKLCLKHCLGKRKCVLDCVEDAYYKIIKYSK